MMLTARWLLDHEPNPSDERIRETLLRTDLPMHRLREQSCASIRWAAEHPAVQA